MPNRDDHPDMWRRPERGRDERSREARGREDEGRRADPRDAERRSFDQPGRFNSDQARYTGSDYDNYAPLGRDDHRPRPGPQDYQGGYGGQEYGVGAGGREYGHDSDYGGVWGQGAAERSRAHEPRRFERDQPFGQPLGAGPSQAQHQGHDLDPDYLTWRDQQMREHDREYAGWRAEQHRRYDDDYRRFRVERRSHFHQSFEEWRKQQQQAAGQGAEFNRTAPAVQQATDGEAPSPVRKAGEAGKDEDKR